MVEKKTSDVATWWETIDVLRHRSSSTLNCAVVARAKRSLFSSATFVYCAMADYPAKKAKMSERAPRVRFTLELSVEPGMEERLESVKKRIQRVKEVLRITPRTPLGTITMMERLLDSFERSEQRGMVSESHSSLFTSFSIPLTSSHHSCDATTQTDVFGYEVLPYVLCHGENTTGCFDIHTPSTPDENYFISSTDAMRNLFGTLSKYNGKCPLSGFVFDMQSFLFQRHGHAVRISVNCAAGHSLRWYSSSVIAGKYTVNLR